LLHARGADCLADSRAPTDHDFAPIHSDGQHQVYGDSLGMAMHRTPELEAQGCVAPGGGPKLADEIAKSLPLNSNAAFRLLYASSLEVGPQVRLQVVSPILREFAEPSGRLRNQSVAYDRHQDALAAQLNSYCSGVSRAGAAAGGDRGCQGLHVMRGGPAASIAIVLFSLPFRLWPQFASGSITGVALKGPNRSRHSRCNRNRGRTADRERGFSKVTP
jgi:hypothetical protein